MRMVSLQKGQPWETCQVAGVLAQPCAMPFGELTAYSSHSAQCCACGLLSREDSMCSSYYSSLTPCPHPKNELPLPRAHL
jgi:hypothetical protein